MSGHLDGPPPGPPDPPYIEGDLGAPSAEEFVHKRRSARAMSTTPDERLREAGEAMAAWVRDNICGSECGDNCEAGANALARWDNTLARLAAADREKPEASDA